MTFLEDRDLQDVPNIKEYYANKTIFVTGGSGFMGTVLIEKLLYSCTDLERIYLLLRSKKGVNSEDRLADLYKSSCFERLRKERPGVFERKVFSVAGDISELGLGLSEEDRALLINRVNIVFHVAASVRFNDTLDYAAKLNLRGTREIIDLAKEMQCLESFVHVSTSYSNTNRDTIEEVIYPPHADWRDTLAICEALDPETLKILTPKYLGELPNTYVFTKQLAEHVVYQNKGIIPAVILRPSIVISSHLEPLPGWNANLNGPVGIMVASAKGILRTTLSKPDLISDYIPVDVAVKNFIAAAWIRGTKKLKKTDDIPIYNICAGSLNNITVKEIREIGFKVMEEIPLDGALWVCSGGVTSSRFKYNISVIFEHLLPALIVDAFYILLGKKPILTKIQRRIYSVQIALQYYTTQQWTFCNENFTKLRAAIKDVDKDEFYYEVEKIDQYKFFKISTHGARKYILNEKDEDIPKAREHNRRLRNMQRLVHGLFYMSMGWWILNTNLVQSYLY
ncbi:putative fatty acyl-CoA reductase CG5065 [Zerene cesonia]|uniref:putative fatty acyl-CoA reductase CG5065 n=1 Tax=Zerene cesonia TaxID=33412 RepID=UPI0018E58A08|nr:putative fatty acyl-CoA reductase CG5065 [Zerene cesonia]